MMPQNVPLIDIHLARERVRLGDVDGSIELARTARAEYLRSGDFMWFGVVCATLTESLLYRGTAADLSEAKEVINRLAAVPTEPGVIVYEIWLLRMRALLAQAERDDTTYRDHRDRYRKMAADLGFEGHMAWAAEMV
jgi:adenylate cyclase